MAHRLLVGELGLLSMEVDMKMCPMLFTPTIQEEETAPLVKLGDLSPLFVEHADPCELEHVEHDDDEEQEREPLVKLGNLSPMFLGE